jgi:hypothetical protein
MLQEHRTKIFVVAMLVAFGCGGVVRSEDASQESDALSTVEYGVDYAWSHPSISSIKSAGYRFAARYYSHDSTKDLSSSEASSLIAAGMSVMGVFEDGATNALGGYNQGVSDAKLALQEANGVGEPSSRPIYFAIDFDASGYGLGSIESYFDGVASVIGLNRVGAYGGYYAVHGLFNANKIKYGWQTSAWSGGAWDARAQVRQINYNILGGTSDLDAAMAPDFGQWGNYNPGAGGGSGVMFATERTAINSAGGADVFIRQTNGSYAVSSQSTPGGAFSAFASLGGNFKSDPTPAVDSKGQMHVFGVSQNNQLYESVQSTPGGAFSSWTSLGGSIQNAVSVGTNADGRLEVFARGTDDALWHVWIKIGTESTWSAFSSLGGKIQAPPVVARNANGRLEVVVVGEDSALYHIEQNSPGGGWGSYWKQPSVVGSAPAIITNHAGELELFVLGTDQRLYHSWQEGPNGTWSAFGSIGGGQLNSAPAVAMNSSGHIEVFGQGLDHHLYHTWQTAPGGAWASFASLGGYITDGISATVAKDGTFEAFVRGSNGATYVNEEHPSGTFAGFVDLGGDSTGF